MKFQFHTGSIKSEQDFFLEESEGSFQFHTGSIKRRPWWQLLRQIALFQFHTGSIKSLDIAARTQPDLHVSIPYWFD